MHTLAFDDRDGTVMVYVEYQWGEGALPFAF